MQDAPTSQTAQLPLRRAETAAGFVLIVQIVAAAVAMGLALGFTSRAALAEAWHLIVGVAVWVVALIHQRFRRLADEEAHDVESLRARTDRGSSSLFEEEQQLDLFLQRNRLAQFEKYFLPGFALALAAWLGWLSYSLIRGVATVETPPIIGQPMLQMAIFFGIAFTCFLLGRYTGGLASHAPWRAVRAGASFTMSNAVGALLVGVGLLCYHFQIDIVERVVAYVIPSVLVLTALEILVSQILAIYRPRQTGQERRPAYDSRLFGMLTEARGLFHTVGDTLDYQFGFKVSETWFFRFMLRIIVPLALFQAVTLYLLTCFVIIDSGEEAIIERFGKPLKGTEALGPGFHFKWPWPVDIVRRHPTERIEMLMIGEQLKEDVDGYLWTESHAKEPFNLLVASEPTAAAGEPDDDRKTGDVVPVSLLSGTFYVYYTVDDLYKYLYTYRYPKQMLDALCYRELTRYAVSADFIKLLAENQQKAVGDLANAIQTNAREENLGVRIVGVSLQGTHPPVEVGPSFEDVVSALEDAETEKLKAQAHAADIVPTAEGEAGRLEAQAEVYSYRRGKVAQAEADRFLKRLEVYRVSPRVFRYREALAVLEEALAGRRKVIKPEWLGANEVIIINVEDKLKLGVLDQMLNPTGGSQ